MPRSRASMHRPTPERLPTKRMPFTPRIIWRLLVVRKVRTTALTAAPNRRDSMSDPGLIQNKWLRLGVSIFADRQLFSSFVLIAHETIHSKEVYNQARIFFGRVRHGVECKLSVQRRFVFIVDSREAL